jgi:hypothetical protein
MTEELWENGTDPLPMLDQLFPIRGENSKLPPTRKSRLYFVACARRVWDRLPWACRELIEIAEEAVDRRKDDRRRLRDLVSGVAELLVSSSGSDPEVVAEFVEEAEQRLRVLLFPEETSSLKPIDPKSVPDGWDGITQLVYAPYAGDSGWHRQVPAELHSADLIRDVFGNPFLPPPPMWFRPAWQTSTAVELARQMYEGRDFWLMPILGDALQDAGCGDRAILAHCHDPRAAHVRGCWVVDLVLGKK